MANDADSSVSLSAAPPSPERMREALEEALAENKALRSANTKLVLAERDRIEALRAGGNHASDGKESEGGKDYPICCYCDHALSCGNCGREQPSGPTPPDAAVKNSDIIERLKRLETIMASAARHNVGMDVWRGDRETIAEAIKALSKEDNETPTL